MGNRATENDKCEQRHFAAARPGALPLRRLFIFVSALRRFCRCGAACGILSFVLLPFFSFNAYADFRVCNATQRKVGVAVGYRTNTGWVSEGWWQVEPSNCRALIEGDLSSRFYYLYAEDADGVERWNGPVNMCVSESEFKIDGVRNCFPRGFQQFGFREIDTKNQSGWMVQLTDALSPADKAQAKSGGSAAAAGQASIAPARR